MLNSSGSAECQACVDCAFAGDCADEISAFNDTPGANEWIVCVFGNQGMGGCPADDPGTQADEAQPCLEGCNAAAPDAAAAYANVLGCVVCVQCPNNCDAATNCGG